MLRGLVALLLVGLGPTGCAGDGRSDRLTVFAASSLTQAFRALDTGADFSFGSSSRLVAQVVEGAPVDVLATADEQTMQRVVDAGLVAGAPVVFAANRLVIAHRGAVRVVGDLARPGLRVVLAAPAVPAGRYAAEALAAAGVTVRPVSLELDVKAVAAKVASGEADAGIVYATDADADGLQSIDVGVKARYAIAALRDDGRRFVDLVRSEKGRRVLADHGFGLP